MKKYLLSPGISEFIITGIEGIMPKI